MRSPLRNGGGARVALLLVLGIFLATARPVAAQDLRALAREITDLEGRLEAVSRQPLRNTAVRSPTFVEERLTDGELFYRLQDYLRASIIFTDIVENYPNHAAYPDALFLLGESLFQAGDYLGARSRFRMVIDHANEARFGPYVQRALGRLIEIAIHIRDFDGVEGYFLQLSRLAPGEVEATTAYFRAKYLYNRAVPDDESIADSNRNASTEPTPDATAPAAGTAPIETAPAQLDLATLEQSRQAFEAVGDGSTYYPQAR